MFHSLSSSILFTISFLPFSLSISSFYISFSRDNIFFVTRNSINLKTVQKASKESIQTLYKLASMQNHSSISLIKSPSTEHAQSSTLRILLLWLSKINKLKIQKNKIWLFWNLKSEYFIVWCFDSSFPPLDGVDDSCSHVDHMIVVVNHLFSFLASLIKLMND